jgi:hypothetical protein
MSTTYTVQELAQRYAEALVEYHTAQQSAVCAPIWVSEARDALYKAQDALNWAAERAAE